MTSFWSAWIIVLTTVTIVAIVWLLFATRKIKNPRSDNTTGHVYDGIVEEDNPLPGWWFSMFIISIIFGIGYLIVYPGMGNYKGLLNWTSASEHDQRLAQVRAAFKSSTAEFTDMSIDQLATNTKAINMGRRMFANNCAVCHGVNAEGGFGFPNLTDSEWQWGGSDAQILQSITHGRTASMPAWQGILTEQKINQVVTFIKSKSISEQAASSHAVATNEDIQQGQTAFNTYCVACHNSDATGNVLLGSPSLVDDVWLYGSTESQLYISIIGGRNGQMPVHSGLLSEGKIRLLAAYIRSLASD